MAHVFNPYFTQIKNDLIVSANMIVGTGGTNDYNQKTTIQLTIPAGITVVEADIRVAVTGHTGCVIRNTANNKQWALVTNRNVQAGDIERFYIGVTPLKTYTLFFDCNQGSMAMFNWSDDINKIIPNINDY